MEAPGWWCSCRRCERVFEYRDLRLLDRSIPCPRCGERDLRRIWPCFAIEAVEAASTVDPEHLRATCILSSAAAEAMLGEVLAAVARRALADLDSPTPALVRIVDRITALEGREKRCSEIKALSGSSVKDHAGAAHEAWYSAWDIVVKYRNAYAHGTSYPRGRIVDPSDDAVVAAVQLLRDDMLPAFAAITNATMDSLFPIEANG